MEALSHHQQCLWPAYFLWAFIHSRCLFNELLQMDKTKRLQLVITLDIYDSELPS